jgi:hypothetical protein
MFCNPRNYENNLVCDQNDELCQRVKSLEQYIIELQDSFLSRRIDVPVYRGHLPSQKDNSTGESVETKKSNRPCVRKMRD